MPLTHNAAQNIIIRRLQKARQTIRNPRNLEERIRAEARQEAYASALRLIQQLNHFDAGGMVGGEGK